MSEEKKEKPTRGTYVEYVDFVPAEKRKAAVSGLKHKDLGNGRYHGCRLGCLIEAAFRGIKTDIEKVAKITHSNPKRIKRISDIVYELYVDGRGAKEANGILRAIEKAPGCKVVIYFCDKWTSQTVVSETGYPFITYTPSYVEMHAKEDDTPWFKSVDPYFTHIEWDELDYVVEKDGKLMQMYAYAEEKNIRVRFVEGGAKIIRTWHKKGIINVPQTIKGEPVIDINSWLVDETVKEIRAPYVAVNEWLDKKSRKKVVLGYARGLKEGKQFDEEVIKKNNKYIKAQRRHLFDLASTDQSLLSLMLEQKMITDKDIPVLMEKINAAGNDELSAMVRKYCDANLNR